uniref:Histidine kinase n=1 Tax=Panagrellus redivivus TaxID=6233 RepID=A0A7E4VXC3_PANRE
MKNLANSTQTFAWMRNADVTLQTALPLDRMPIEPEIVEVAPPYSDRFAAVEAKMDTLSVMSRLLLFNDTCEAAEMPNGAVKIDVTGARASLLLTANILALYLELSMASVGFSDASYGCTRLRHRPK